MNIKVLHNVFCTSLCLKQTKLNNLFSKTSSLHLFNSINQSHSRFLHQITNSNNLPTQKFYQNRRNFSGLSPLKPNEIKSPEFSKDKLINLNQPIEISPKLSIYQRFKATYAVYGKLCLVIHAVTYCGWFSFFYLIVHSGIDIKRILTFLQFPESLTNLLGKPGVGELATVYILCKIFIVFRYGLTMYLTRYFGQRFQRMGYMAPIKQENTIMNLAKESKEFSKDKLKSHLKKKIKG